MPFSSPYQGLDAPYRAAVTREFAGLQRLYGAYLAALRDAYPLPTVPDPTAP